MIPWIVEALPVPEANVTVLLGNGTHRANTEDEIAGMFGAEVAGRLRIQNHDAYDRSENVYLGKSGCGTDVWLDRAYVEADRRIVVGFIEPHFFAGFSGGPKGVAPGVPDHGNFAELMRAGEGPQDVFQAVHDREPILDQWQAQTLAAILERVEVGVYSSMARPDIEACKLAAVDDLNAALRERVLAIGHGAQVAVLPDGPLTIPYLTEP